MKRFFAWILFALLIVQTVSLGAECTTRISDKAYDLEVRSVYMHTSANGKYSVLKYSQTTGVKQKVNQIVLEYDFEEQDAEHIGKFEEDAPLAFVIVDGFDGGLAALEPENVVLTVNGLPIEAEAYADAYGHVGWENVYSKGQMSAVFPLVLTKQGGVYDFAVRVQGLCDGVKITETADIQVELVNTHEYKDEKEAKILHLESDEAEVYIVGDKIYIDHPVGAADKTKVKITFGDETGRRFDCITWAENTLCKAENMQAALYLDEELRLDKDSTAEYRLAGGSEQERREKVRFVLETKEALYKTKEYAIVERFGVEKEDPKGIYFAETVKTLRVGEVYTPIVLGVKTDEVLCSGVFGTLTFFSGENTDQRVIDVSDGKCVIAVKPGEAYVTAKYEGGGRIYDASSMKIVVTEDIAKEYTVLCRTLNVRAGAGMEAQIVGQVHRGDTVCVVDEDNGWAQLEDGRYAASQYIGRK